MCILDYVCIYFFLSKAFLFRACAYVHNERIAMIVLGNAEFVNSDSKDDRAQCYKQIFV